MKVVVAGVSSANIPTDVPLFFLLEAAAQNFCVSY